MLILLPSQSYTVKSDIWPISIHRVQEPETTLQPEVKAILGTNSFPVFLYSFFYSSFYQEQSNVL
jgi:hypothetical protein